MYANAAFLIKLIAFKHFYPRKITHFPYLIYSFYIYIYLKKVLLLFYFLNMRLTLIINPLMLVSNKIR